MSKQSWYTKRVDSMRLFINRHRIEARLGNLNPEPIVPVDFRTSQAIPRHIDSSSEEYQIYKNLWDSEQILPVCTFSARNKK